MQYSFTTDNLKNITALKSSNFPVFILINLQLNDKYQFRYIFHFFTVKCH